MSSQMNENKGLKVSERLYNKAIPIWESYYAHPFVKGIADGTLPVSKFQYYMIQNLERIVELCSYYEYQFWDMAWNEGYEFKAELK